MTINRREVLKGGAALSALALIPAAVRGAPRAEWQPPWRTFDVTTRVALGAGSRTSAWIPVPSLVADDWIRPIGTGWSTNGTTAMVREIGSSGAKLLHVQWPDGVAAPVAEVTTRIAVRDRRVDPTVARATPALSAAEQDLYLSGTSFVPVDGIVRETADRITAGAADELDRVRKIYDWIVANTFRDPSVGGCGTGDVVAMLKSGRMGGKCADINALFVGLARASGIPARELYGIRIAPSALGYRSLGIRDNVTTAQHCRAEVHLSGVGWVPMDPADVRKVILEEPGDLKLGDAKVEALRRMLFGGWEMNWIAYNDLRDVSLPGSAGPRLPFFMYPQAEIADARLDCLDAGAFTYRIVSREIAA